jgi:hypothetical protein
MTAFLCYFNLSSAWMNKNKKDIKIYMKIQSLVNLRLRLPQRNL